MPQVGYRFFKASDPLEIKEQQYACATEVRFSPFTSCMGIIAKQGDDVYGLHLVQQGVYDEADRGRRNVEMKLFGPLEALEVGSLFPARLEFAVFVGNTGGFKLGACGPGYRKLMDLFEERTTLFRNYQDDGTFGARLDAREPRGLLLYEARADGTMGKITIETNV